MARKLIFKRIKCLAIFYKTMKFIIIIILIVLFLVGIFLWYIATDTPPGRANLLFRGKPTKEELLANYIQGLKENNAKQIIKLVPRNYDAEEVAKQKVTSLHNSNFNNLKIVYKELMSPYHLEATINNDSFNDIVYIKRIQKRWYLLLGKARDAVLQGTEMRVQ